MRKHSPNGTSHSQLTERERQLRDALAEVMGLRKTKMSIAVTFAEQGVDSLMGLRFVRKLHDMWGVEIELEWLFDYPTIKQLSSFLDERFESERTD
jgi:acyl carrier protein